MHDIFMKVVRKMYEMKKGNRKAEKYIVKMLRKK